MQCPKSQLPRPARASGALSGRFLSYSRERRRKQGRTAGENHQRQPNNACIFSRQQQRDKKQTTVGQSVRKRKQTRARPRRLLEYSAHALGTGWPVRGASSARPSVRAQCNLGRGYLHILHLLGCCTLCTTWQWLASFACSPLLYRRDSRAEVTAHRAWHGRRHRTT